MCDESVALGRLQPVVYSMGTYYNTSVSITDGEMRDTYISTDTEHGAWSMEHGAWIGANV